MTCWDSSYLSRRITLMVYLSNDWLSASHALFGCTSPFLLRPAASLAMSFSNFFTRSSRFEVSIARSCRFMRC
jgi:hypothetical protein